MKRYVSLSLIICLIFTMFPMSSNAYITRTITVTKETVIPFNTTSSTSSTYTNVSIPSNYTNVQVIGSAVDNGSIISTSLGSGYISIYLDNATFNSTSQTKTVSNKETISIPYQKEDDPVNHTITTDTIKAITFIESCSGDFLSVVFNGSKITAKIDTTKGKLSPDPDGALTTESVSFSLDDTNRNQNISVTKSIPYDVVGNLRTKISPQSGVVSFTKLGNLISAHFDKGNPKLNETTYDMSHTYFVIDRHRDGHFSPYIPKWIYRADNYFIPDTWKGYYLTADTGIVSYGYRKPEWSDFWGYIIDGKKYYYSGSQSTRLFLKTDVKNETLYNTEKFFVTITDNQVTYKPEGRLDKPKEIFDPYSFEIQDTFYNPIDKKEEPYVRHYWFHYGPDKHLFGGYYTYPYTATCEYDRVKDVKLYTGSVTYNYDQIVTIPGSSYNYNGWIKIKYNQQETVNDYPPSVPFNVSFDYSTMNLKWNPSTDDYTPQNQLVYDVEVRKTLAGAWESLGRTGAGITNMSYPSAQSGYKYRVRAIDNANQAGDWGYSTEGKMTLTGTLTPSATAAGENIKIDAFIKTSGTIQSVTAACPALGINTTLGYVSKTTPNGMEFSFPVYYNYYSFNPPYIYSNAPATATYSANSLKVKPWALPANNGTYSGCFNIALKRASDDGSTLINNYPINKKGTVIIPNDNYLNTPLDMYWTVDGWRRNSFANALYILRKDNNKERFISYEQYSANNIPVYNSWGGWVGYKSPINREIKVNTFTKNANGSTIYQSMPITVSDVRYPLTVTWNTVFDSAMGCEMTTFTVYSGVDKIGTFKSKWSDIINHTNGFTAYEINKISYKYIPSPGTEYGADWYFKGNAGDVSEWTQFRNRNITDTASLYTSIPWAGYKVLTDQMATQSQIDNYNNALTTRFNYRLLFSDEEFSDSDISRYLDLVRSSNASVQENVFLLNVTPSNYSYSKSNIPISAAAQDGIYSVDIIAVLTDGTSQTIQLPLTIGTPINPKGVMPLQVGRNKTYTVTATSSKYVNDMKLIVFGNTYTMSSDGFNAIGDRKWKYSLTIPSTASVGSYNQITGTFRQAEFKATLPSGQSASDMKSFEVVMPAAIDGPDLSAQPGETIQITAKTAGYCTSASVDMPTGTVNLTADKPINYYENTWRANYTVPNTQPCNTYGITYKAANAYMTASKPANLYVDLFLNPIGDVPDNIETKTNFKIKCVTTLSAISVKATLSPTPSVAQYTLNLVSQDSSKKYWESADLQYPEGSAGSSAGKVVTGTFTAAASNGKTETCTDTGHLWEKLEITGFELRRFLYRNSNASDPVVETLCRSQSTGFSDSVGFTLAGWKMGMKVMTKGYVDKIEMDFDEPEINYQKDDSIKIFDKLTKSFEWDTPVKRGRIPNFSSLALLQDYYKFPKQFSKACSPQTNLNNIYTTYYLIPYGTKQSLHSWYTLREESKDAFNIDKNRLLERIKEPFRLKLKIYSGSRYITKEIRFDVFERWDTLLNRDISLYLDNPGDHDPISKNTWETTDYIEDYFKNLN